MSRQRLLRTSLLLVIGLAIASLIAVYQIKSEQAANNIVSKNFGGPFTLTNQKGDSVTEKDFKGTFRLIYFGFTYCPAICPTELQRITAIMKELGPQAQQIQPIFITVDPERDTVDVMKNYLLSFHPRMIGLTGTPEQIEQAKKSYKIYAAKVQDETMSDYTMDHSSFIYFMGPNEELIRIFKADESIPDMVAVIKEFLP